MAGLAHGPSNQAKETNGGYKQTEMTTRRQQTATKRNHGDKNVLKRQTLPQTTCCCHSASIQTGAPAPPELGVGVCFYF